MSRIVQQLLHQLPEKCVVQPVYGPSTNSSKTDLSNVQEIWENFHFESVDYPTHPIVIHPEMLVYGGEGS
jgi:hypothetical protein